MLKCIVEPGPELLWWSKKPTRNV